MNSIGTLMGTIEIAAGDPMRITIRDPAYSRPIRCWVPASLIDQVYEYQGGRVEITGPVEYAADGKPESIQVQSIESMDDDLPTPGDVRNILVDE